MAGLDLDPWQQFVLGSSLGEREDGNWAAFEVGLVVSRQNGKGGVLEARELAGLFLFEEQLITHTAHQFDTSLEAFGRLLQLIEETPDLDRKVQRVSKSHGEEGITLKGGQRIRFRTRTAGGGRGFSGELLILDEAMILPAAAHGALLPTLSARPNTQIWYTATAVNQEVHEHGEVLTRVRNRGLEGGDPALAYFEFSPDITLEEAIAPDVARDERHWAAGNPALGIRITSEHVAREQRSLDPRNFAIERLSVGDWPNLNAAAGSGIDMTLWRGLHDDASTVLDPVCFALDVRPNRSRSAIGVAGARPDDLKHVEVLEHHEGTGWLIGRAVELSEKHEHVAWIYDERSPAAALAPALIDAGIRLRGVSAQEYAQACGLFLDVVNQRILRHLDSAELNAALRGAGRTTGDTPTWSRRRSSVDISPLVTVTLALWGSANVKPKRKLRMSTARL